MKYSRMQSIKNLIHAIRPYRVEMIASILSGILKQISILLSVALTAYLVGAAVAGTLLQNFKYLLAVLIVCILLRAVANFGEMGFSHDVAFRVLRDYRISIYDKISKLAPAFTLRKKTGQLGQALVSDVELLELFLAHTFSVFIVALIMIVVVFGILLAIDPLLAAALVISAVLTGIVPYSLRKRADRQGTAVREQMADANSMMVEGVQGLREILTLSGKDSYLSRLDAQMNALYRAQQVYGRRKGQEGMMMHILGGVFTVAVMIITAVMVAQGRMDFSMYPMAVMLSTVVLTPVNEVAAVAQELGLVFAAANRIHTIQNTEPAVKDSGTEVNTAEKCSIQFKNVSFRYEDDGEEILKNVSFTIAPGETALLVGHSGAGKTTCANLLLRYWYPQKGAVLINEKNIRQYTIESLRETVSAVQQEPYLFHTSIRDNIRLGYKAATEQDVIAAATAANAHSFICALPNGYDTIVGERGFRLSGGQRQRVTIARAILRNRPVVIFDEAVSNLDTENERDIQEMLRQEMQGKTILMIAHRLSTILSADKIIMLEHGAVVAIGTHKELMNTCEKYRTLIKNQIDRSDACAHED